MYGLVVMILILRGPGFGLMGQHGITQIGALGNPIIVVVVNIVWKCGEQGMETGMTRIAMTGYHSSVRRNDQALMFISFQKKYFQKSLLIYMSN